MKKQKKLLSVRKQKQSVYHQFIDIRTKITIGMTNTTKQTKTPFNSTEATLNKIKTLPKSIFFNFAYQIGEKGESSLLFETKKASIPF